MSFYQEGLGVRLRLSSSGATGRALSPRYVRASTVSTPNLGGALRPQPSRETLSLTGQQMPSSPQASRALPQPDAPPAAFASFNTSAQAAQLEEVLQARSEVEAEFERCRDLLDHAYSSTGVWAGAAVSGGALLDGAPLDVEVLRRDEEWWIEEEARRAREVAVWEDCERERRARQLAAWETEERRRWEAEEADRRRRLNAVWDTEEARLRQAAELRWQAEEHARAAAEADAEVRRRVQAEELETRRGQERAAWEARERSRRKVEAQRWATATQQAREQAEREERTERDRSEREARRASWERQEVLRREAEHERWQASQQERRAAERLRQHRGLSPAAPARVSVASPIPRFSPTGRRSAGPREGRCGGSDRLDQCIYGTPQPTLLSAGAGPLFPSAAAPADAAGGSCGGWFMGNAAPAEFVHTGGGWGGGGPAAHVPKPQRPPACGTAALSAQAQGEVDGIAAMAAAAAMEMAAVHRSSPAPAHQEICSPAGREDGATTPPERTFSVLRPASPPSRFPPAAAAAEAMLSPAAAYRGTGSAAVPDSAVSPVLAVGAADRAPTPGCPAHAAAPFEAAELSAGAVAAGAHWAGDHQGAGAVITTSGHNVVAVTARIAAHESAAAALSSGTCAVAQDEADAADVAHCRATAVTERVRRFEDEARRGAGDDAGEGGRANEEGRWSSGGASWAVAAATARVEALLAPVHHGQGVSRERVGGWRPPQSTFVKRREPMHLEAGEDEESYEAAMRAARAKLKMPRGGRSLLEEERRQAALREEALQRERREAEAERSSSSTSSTPGGGLQRRLSSGLAPIETTQMEAERRQFTATRAAEREAGGGRSAHGAAAAAKLEALRLGTLQTVPSCQMCKQKLYPTDMRAVDGYQVSAAVGGNWRGTRRSRQIASRGRASLPCPSQLSVRAPCLLQPATWPQLGVGGVS